MTIMTIIFITKSGRSNSFLDLEGRDSKNLEKRVDLHKKKRKVNTCLAAGLLQFAA